MAATLPITSRAGDDVTEAGSVLTPDTGDMSGTAVLASWFQDDGLAGELHELFL